MTTAHRIFAALGLLAVVSCTSGSSTAAQKPAATAGDASPGGIDLAGIDRSVAPGDDFFGYANGAWVKATPIPADRGAYGASSIIADATEKRVADLIAEAAKSDAPAGSEARKIGDYYATFLDEAAIEAKGLDAFKPDLEQVAAVADAQGLARLLGSQLRADVDVLNSTNLDTGNLFGLWVAQDLDDPSKYAAFLLQGGLGLPDRDYYLDPSERMETIRVAYRGHLAALHKLAGIPDGEAKAGRIFALEKRIAAAHSSRADTQDVIKGNNHWSRADFDTKAPGLDWKTYFEAAGLGNQKGLVMWQPGAATGIAAAVKAEPLATWKEYLVVRALERNRSVPKAFTDERFAFFGKILSGTPEQRPRWKRAISATDEALGEAVGKLYVERYFPPSEKARAEQMVKNVLAAFGRRIDALEWMAPQTKAKAKAKLAVLKVGVGYPDKWRDYSGLEVIRGDAIGNERRSSVFEYQRRLKRLAEPVDRGEWVMNPQLVNAVNLPAMNAMNFPAAILQPPNFDPSRPEAMDYGSAGATIGHEISHSFDEEGALFDESGRLKNWWTPSDFAHFKESSGQLVKQYDQYKPFPDLAVNGKLTISENIADVAGLAAAYDAYRLSLGGKEAPVVQGFTGDQQFFLSFAQSWRAKLREPLLRQIIVVDGHAPPEYRADTVRNQDAWYQAFDVKPGQGLYLPPSARVRMW